MNKKIKQAIRHAELEIKRKDEEKWQALAEKIGEQKVEEIQGSLKVFADLYITWKKLENIAPKTVYDEWWKEEHDKPIAEALNRLELKVRGKECKARDCNNIFVPKRSDQVYCSTRCRDREVKRRYRQRKKELSIR